MRWCVVALLGPLLCDSAPLVAQQLRGAVRDSAAGTPIPGAVVFILDSAGVVGARTITDGVGRFALVVRPLAARLRVIRIGYQPREVALPASLDATLTISMFRLPARLDAMRVTDRELCPGSTDRGPAFQLWEQARAGLLGAVVAREANPAMATTLWFKRQFPPNDSLVRHQDVRVTTGQTTRPFVAAEPAAVFAHKGYMMEDARGRTYNAPDADVLLDESFATTHCFRLRAADNSHRGQIGLAFAPVPGGGSDRDSIVDVNGVIWMDRDVPALRSLEFRYTELEPAAINAGTGGHIEFHTMANGISFIERWWLRLPIMTAVRTPRAMVGGDPRLGTPTSAMRSELPVPRRRQERLDLRVDQIDESGGLVLAAKWNDGTSWEMPHTGITGEVAQRSAEGGTGSAGSRMASRAFVTLAGTADTVVADERGRFTMMPVAPGRYTVTAADTTLRAFLASRGATRVIDVPRDSMVTLRLEVAPMATALDKLCAGPKSRQQTTTVVGRVLLAGTESPRRAQVRATWLADVDLSSGAVVTNGIQTVSVDDAGRFAVCGVAAGRPVQLHLTHASGSADTTFVAADSNYRVIDWRPKRPDVPPLRH